MLKQIGLSAVLVLSSLFAGFASYAEEQPVEFVVQNNSFESAAGNGAPEKWSCSPQYFSVDSGDAHSGNSCLKWSGDGKEYKLCSQTLDIPAGSVVDFSVWIKTKDLKDGKATVCLEWNRQDGTWYAGSYASGIDGSDNEWRQVKSRAFIPKDAVSPHLACYVTQGGSGVAWFDDVTVVKTAFPLFSAITTDRYRAQSDGGKVDVYVGYTATSDEFDADSLAPKLAIINSNKEEVASASLEEVLSQTDCYYRFSFDSTAIAPGDYTLSCSAVNPETKKTETIATRFSKLDKIPERTSYIDEHLRLIHSGQPFFPLGLYFAAPDADDVKLIADSAFNCVMPYAAISRETVDSLYQNGIYTVYSVKDNFPTLSVKTMEEGNAKTERMVGAMKDAPGVIAWYINDELPSTMVADLAARRDQLEALDPSRPTWVVLYQVDELRSYLSTYDVIGSDPYPIPNKPASTAAEWTKKTVNAGFGRRAVWQVPQIFNWASYKKGDEKANYRSPTFEEMRGMSWQCIAEGANGLIYYSFFDLQRMDKTVEEGGRALVAEPFDKRWGEVKKIAQEIADQFPILLAVEPTLDVVLAEENPNVSYRLYGTDEGTWLLAVNKTAQEQTAVFSVPEGAKIVETRLGEPPVQNGARVSVVLQPLEPKLIRVK